MSMPAVIEPSDATVNEKDLSLYRRHAEACLSSVVSGRDLEERAADHVAHARAEVLRSW